jgi:hypothetical protein
MHQSSSDLGEIFSAHFSLATFNAIASLLLHENETNKIYFERTRKDKEIGPTPSLPAQFV